MRNLIIFSNANGYGGAERSLESIVKGLIEFKQFRITIFVSNKKHIKNLKNIEDVKLIILQNGNSIKVTYNNLKTIYPTLKDADTILVNTNKGAFYLSLLSYFTNLKNKKILIYIRDFQWKYQKFIFNSLKNMNIKYLFTTQAFFDIETYFSKVIKNYKIIPNFIDIKDVNLDSKNNNGQIKNIIIPAMINRWKGIEYAIEAIKDIENVKLQIIGKIIDEEYFQELIALIDNYDIKGKIEFIEYTDNIEQYYKDSYIVLNTSISEYGGPETFGRTILEAWSFKKPIIAFNCGGPKYIIEDKKDGFLVKEKDVEELEKTILYLLDDIDLYTKIVFNGYKKVSLLYNKKFLIGILSNEIY